MNNDCGGNVGSGDSAENRSHRGFPKAAGNDPSKCVRVWCDGWLVFLFF